MCIFHIWILLCSACLVCLCSLKMGREMKVLLPLVCCVIDRVHVCLFTCWGIKRVPISFHCRRNKKYCKCRSCPSKAFCSWPGLEYLIRNFVCCECIDDCVLCVSCMSLFVTCQLKRANMVYLWNFNFNVPLFSAQYTTVFDLKNLDSKKIISFPSS